MNEANEIIKAINSLTAAIREDMSEVAKRI